MESLRHNNIEITVFDNGQFVIKPYECDEVALCKNTDKPNFEINIAGGKMLLLSPDEISYLGTESKENGIILKYDYQKKLIIGVNLTFVPGSDVIVQQNTILNISEETVKLTRFSSAILYGLCNTADMPYYQNSDIKLWICHNKWQGEGQWRSYTPDMLGIYPTSTHDWERASYRITSFGSWSTSDFYPMTVAEDGQSGYSWFMETEGSHSWMLKYTGFGGYTSPTLSLEATGADEQLGWCYNLEKGKSYQSERAIYGVTEGSFENAVGQLLTFKRLDTTAFYEDDTPPVIFNVYMDCIWGDPSPSRLIPLIDKAALVGAEIFVIDGGWSRNQNGDGIGDWIPNEKYDGTPLSEIVKLIKSKGMIPGIWTELDTVNPTALGYTLDKDAVLKRHGSVIGQGNSFYNFNNEKVREYLKGRIKYLYDVGFRYIKNDYNHSSGIGSTNNSTHSPLEGERSNADAFVSFIEEVRDEYPDLIIENCCSGALRSDNKMLRHFNVQSTSDQELYLNNASILMGSMTQFPPEKCGVWAYPFPAVFDVRDTFEADAEFIKEREDGHETVFNMATAMLGTMFLSGRIDCCDTYNLDLIRLAVEKYKSIRHLIPKSRPIYPCGLCSINKSGNYAFGLLSSERLLAIVWNIGSNNDYLKIDFSDYINGGRIVDAYFAIDSIEYGFADDELSVKFSGKNIAALFEIGF